MTNRQKGISLIILSAFCFSLMNLFVKLAANVPSVQKSFFRNLIALIIATFLLKKHKLSFRWRKDTFSLLFARSAFGAIGVLCNFYAVSQINLSDATMLNKLSPFYVILFSYLFLKEKVSFKQICYIFLAFLGSLLIIKPGFSFGTFLPSILGFIGGICAGAAYTTVRALGLKKENSHYIVFFFSAFTCFILLPYIIFSYAPMNGKEFFFLILASIFGAGGQYAITAAYFYAPSREISIYDYTIVIFTSIWSLLFWNDFPDVYSITGYLMIFTASALLFFYNKKIHD